MEKLIFPEKCKFKKGVKNEMTDFNIRCHCYNYCKDY